MVEKISFATGLYNFIRNAQIAQVVRSKIYRLDNKEHQQEYQRVISNFKKWIFWSKPYVFENVKVNEVYFDFERMISEYSLHYGIKSGEEILSEGALKPTKKETTMSIEDMISQSLQQIDKHVENTVDPNYSDFIKSIESDWKKAFVINCVPNVLHGNYVNIPVEFVSTTRISDDVAEFKDNEEYFFTFLNRLPLKINRIRIDGREFYNIVNVTIVPLFISTGVDYYLVHENS